MCQILSCGLSVTLESFLTCVHWYALSWSLKKKNPSQVQIPFYLYEILFSPLICSGNVVGFSFYKPWMLSPPLRKTACFYSMEWKVSNSGNCLHSIRWGYCKYYLICFPSLRDNFLLAWCPVSEKLLI